MSDSIEKIKEIQSRGFVGKLGGYGKMTGPGWLQAAVTLGGGSLAGALYLGIVGGYELMWLQPLAMLCGVVMLMALTHVTLEKNEYPFNTVKRKISPILAWGWLIATVIANIVFCCGQASLGLGAVQQNLGVALPDLVITGLLSVVAIVAAIMFVGGSKAAQGLETILKILVALVMLSFLVASIFLFTSGNVDVVAVAKGFIPNPSSLFNPPSSIEPMIEATGASSDFWRDSIANSQKNKIIAAFGSAVGINMTFLLPYTLVKRGWKKEHRELSRFDLVLALLIPFSVATALLVVTSASAFHAKHADILDEDLKPKALAGAYYDQLFKKMKQDGTVLPAEISKVDAFKKLNDEQKTIVIANVEPYSAANKKLAAAMVSRDSKQLATTLEPVMGEKLSHLVFGIGVLAMALSTMMVLMMMNGFAISQAFNKPGEKGYYIIGAILPALLSVFTPLVWTGASKAALLTPAAVMATVFLPIAYFAILLLMNTKSAVGGKKVSPVINILMMISTAIAFFAAVWKLSGSGVKGQVGLVLMAVVMLIALVGFFMNKNKDNA